jgi:hypothetical protein
VSTFERLRTYFHSLIKSITYFHVTQILQDEKITIKIKRSHLPENYIDQVPNIFWCRKFCSFRDLNSPTSCRLEPKNDNTFTHFYFQLVATNMFQKYAEQDLQAHSKLRTRSVQAMNKKLARNHRRYNNVFKTAHENIEYANLDNTDQTITFFLYTTPPDGEETRGYRKLILGDFITISDRKCSIRGWQLLNASVTIQDDSGRTITNEMTESDNRPLRVVLKIPILAEVECLSNPMDVRNELSSTTSVLSREAYRQVLAIAVTKYVHSADKHSTRILTVGNKEGVGSNQPAKIKFRPSYGFVITEALDGDLKNSAIAKHLFYSKPKKRGLKRKRGKNDEHTVHEHIFGWSNSGTMWGLMNLTKEPFQQSHIFRQKDLVHCNLHEGSVRFKTTTLALVEAISVEKTGAVPRFHTHICGFKDLHVITSRSGADFVDTFGTHCKYVPHFAKDNAT